MKCGGGRDVFAPLVLLLQCERTYIGHVDVIICVQYALAYTEILFSPFLQAINLLVGQLACTSPF